MIEKITPDHILGLDGLPTTIMPDSAKLMRKINELVDAVNTIQKEREAERFEIEEWIGILEAVRASVNKLETMAKNTNTVLESLIEENNIHEKQIDDTDDIAEVKNENMPRPIKLYVCADGSVYDNEAVAKSHAASIFNPLPAGATTTDRVYLEQELARTKKQLEIAVDALKLFCGEDVSYYSQSKIDARDARTALEQINNIDKGE